MAAFYYGGCVLPTLTYAEARDKFFPHVYPDQLPSPWPWKRERIYVCPECLQAQNEWLEQNDKTKRQAKAEPQ